MSELSRLQKALESRSHFLPARGLATLRARIYSLKARKTMVPEDEIKIDIENPKSVLSGNFDELHTLGDYNHLICDRANTLIDLPGVHLNLTIRNCLNCEIRLGACSGAIFIENVRCCKISLAAHQIRLFQCEAIQLQVFVSTNIILEESMNIQVEELVPWYESMQSDLSMAGLTGENNFRQIANVTDLNI